MSKKTEKFNYLTYGEKCKGTDIKMFINHMLDANAGQKCPTPLCIWGLAGIGKTSIPKQLAEEKGYQYVYISPAQFEEMGDILGMPYVDKDTQETKFAKPEWVPTTEGPGILLIDDVNRADDRILRGIMQLLQNYETVAWGLPEGWQILLTANPDGGDYSVTSMDNAMLTRMMHITMEFDVKEWARWAEENGVDQRGINFLLKYPEVIDGDISNPRSITAFFNSIKKIKDLRANIKLVNILSKSALSKEASISFQSFINDNLIDLINPDDIIYSTDWDKTKKIIADTICPTKGTVRNDIASILTTRFVNFLASHKTNMYSSDEIKNIAEFMMLPELPGDLKMALVKDVNKLISVNPSLKKVLTHDGVMKALLK